MLSILTYKGQNEVPVDKGREGIPVDDLGPLLVYDESPAGIAQLVERLICNQ